MLLLLKPTTRGSSLVVLVLRLSFALRMCDVHRHHHSNYDENWQCLCVIAAAQAATDDDQRHKAVCLAAHFFQQIVALPLCQLPSFLYFTTIISTTSSSR